MSNKSNDNPAKPKPIAPKKSPLKNRNTVQKGKVAGSYPNGKQDKHA